MLTLIRAVLGIIALFLLLDSLVLFSQLKFNVGTLVPCLIGLIFLAHAIYWQKIADFRHHPLQYAWVNQCNVLKKVNFNRVWQWLWGLFCVWLISLIGFMCYLKSHIDDSQQQLKNPVKAIIVLGSGVKDGQPSATLANRLDTASEVASHQPNALMLVSGGVDIGEIQSEARVMADYLQTAHAIAKEKIALEEKSTSTEENLAFSKAVLAEHHITPSEPMAIVTSDFHVLRAKAIAKKQGYTDVQTVSSPHAISYSLQCVGEGIFCLCEWVAFKGVLRKI